MAWISRSSPALEHQVLVGRAAKKCTTEVAYYFPHSPTGGTWTEIRLCTTLNSLHPSVQINAPGTVPDVPVGTTLIFDDGATGRNPNPDTYVDQASDVRVGQTLRDVEGIMTYGFSAYR